MNVRQRIGELIGAPGRIRLRQINGYSPTRDYSTADYRYWDRARRAKARGLEISGLLLKPLGSKVAAWTLGNAPAWDVNTTGARHAAPHQDAVTAEALNGWWAAHHADILRGYEEALALGDCYLVVNGDLSVTVVPPHVVEPLLDAAGAVAGWRITENLTPANHSSAFPSLRSGEGRTAGADADESLRNAGYGGMVTIVDEYTALGRTRRVLRGGVTLRTERYPNLIGRVPVIHIANRTGADEFYGRPEGDALIPALQRYGDVIDAAIRGNIRQGRPTPVIEKMGTAEQVRKFWEKFGQRETQTLPDGTTETVDVIDFDPDQLLTLGGEAQFKYAAPGSFSGDTQTLLSVLFYLILQHSEIPEAVWGASIPSSRASAETQMQPFLKWITKKRGLAESWLIDVARVALATLAVVDWRIDPDAALRIGWKPLTEDDGRLRLDTITWAHGAGVIGDEEAKKRLAMSG